MKDLKLGLQLGYWGSGPPADAAAAGRRGRAARIRLDLDGRGLRLGRPHPAQLVGFTDRAGPPRHRPLPAVRPHADRDGDGRDHHSTT